ncbi:MAG: winged helix-turn-helix domain-containing protein, partial [Acinetobacter sp.]
MKYLINNEVTFRTDDGVLANLSSSDNSLTLSITANRIFTYLLEQEGKVVSREEMFTNVWDKNGLQASNNSLSQYISLIRKGLQELGCEHEIIQTVPRVGFFIAEGLVATIEEPPSVTVTSLAPSKAAPSLSKRVKMTLLAAGGISLLMLLYPVNSLFNSSKNNLPDVQLFKLGNIDLCPVYTVFESSPEIATAKLEKA